MSRAPRTSDIIRLYYKVPYIPTTSLLLFQFGFFAIVCAIALTTYCVFGYIAGVSFIVIVLSITTFIMIIFNYLYVRNLAHSFYYWFRRNPEDFRRVLEKKIILMEIEYYKGGDNES
jgi:hypothetical protein